MHFYLSMHYGDEASLKGREGEARLTGSMLTRGTAQHDRQQIADTLDRLRASLSINGGQTSLSARGQTLRGNLARRSTCSPRSCSIRRSRPRSSIR